MTEAGLAILVKSQHRDHDQVNQADYVYELKGDKHPVLLLSVELDEDFGQVDCESESEVNDEDEKH